MKCTELRQIIKEEIIKEVYEQELYTYIDKNYQNKFSGWKLDQDYSGSNFLQRTPEWRIYTSPFWEGDKGITAEIHDDKGYMYFMTNIKPLRVKSTGDLAKDADIWYKYTKQVLQKFDPKKLKRIN